MRSTRWSSVRAASPKHDGISYRIDPGKMKPSAAPALFETSTTPGLRPAQRRDRAHRRSAARQHSPGSEGRGTCRSSKVVDSKAAPGAPNLDIEMETGTGKTYVYIKTIMELNKRYGW